jgi:hypothetical protein
MFKLLGYTDEVAAPADPAPKSAECDSPAGSESLGYSMCSDFAEVAQEGATKDPVVMACHSPRASSGDAGAVTVIAAEHAAELSSARAEAVQSQAALQENGLALASALQENEELKHKLTAMQELISGALNDVMQEANKISPKASDGADGDFDDDKDDSNSTSKPTESRLAVAWHGLGARIPRPSSLLGVGLGLGLGGGFYKFLSKRGRAGTRWMPRARLGRVITITLGTAGLAAATCAALRWCRGQPLALPGLRRGGEAASDDSDVAKKAMLTASTVVEKSLDGLQGTLADFGAYIKNTNTEAAALAEMQ